MNILTLNGNDERLSFLGLNGNPICPNCASMCENTIIRYQLDGESTFEIVEPFGEENYISEEDFKRLTTNNLKLSQTKNLFTFPVETMTFQQLEVILNGYKIGNTKDVQTVKRK